MSNLTIEQALLRAAAHLRKGEAKEARILYRKLLAAFPGNTRVQAAQAALDSAQANAIPPQEPPADQIQYLVELYGKGRITEVIERISCLLTTFPNSPSLWNISGVANVRLNRADDAIRAFERCIDLDPGRAEAHNNLGILLKRAGRIDDAIQAYRKALSANPIYADAHYNLGLSLQAQNKLHEAVEAFKAALSIKFQYHEAHYSLGNALKELGDLEQAAEAYRHVISIRPNHADAHANLGSIFAARNNFSDAILSYRRAIEINPHDKKTQLNLGIALQDAGDLEGAIAAYRNTLALAPNSAEAYINLGAALANQGNLDEAVQAYRAGIIINPKIAEGYSNLGAALLAQRKLEEAIAACQTAIELQPDQMEAHTTLASALADQGRFDEAISTWRNAIAIKPGVAELHARLGGILSERGELEGAILSYQDALAIDPGLAHIRAHLLLEKRRLCDWRNLDTILVNSSYFDAQGQAIAPFTMLPAEDNPEKQMQRSCNWAINRYRQPAPQMPPRYSRSTRLRVAYCGSDFHDHATLFLMSGLLREHDRSKFEIFAYSYGKIKKGTWREKAEKDIENFRDTSEYPDKEFIDLVHSDEIDIAIDLKGHTEGSRSHLFQARLAPIQINFLGYPGTMGAGFMDYIIADPNVIPNKSQKFYKEKIIYMPHSYQPNDNTRYISRISSKKTDFNLPDNAFVFCCFNNSYKFTSKEFDIWMRLLHAIEGSVLWLLRTSQWAEQNLRREAVARGIDPARLVFSGYLLHAQHLERLRHADLFIDTFNYNAHTTASDALWAGVPVVTKIGQQFAARVAASLLKAVGLPELITTTEEEYESLILKLASDRTKLAAIRQKLSANRLTHPLFDTKRYTRNFEAGLHKAQEVYLSGRAPEDIWISEN